jgi:hypothetical protein
MGKGLLSYIMIALSACFFKYSYSQDTSPVNFSVNYSLPSQGGVYGVNTKLGLSYPLINTSNTTLLAGVGYRWFRNDMQSDSLYMKDLHYLSLPLAALIKLNNRFKLFLSFETGVSSDVLSFTPVNFRYVSNICLLRASGDTTKWSIILQLISQNGGLSISSNLFINLRLHRRLYFNGVLPFRPKITWKADNRNHYGIAVTTDCNSFILSDKEKSKYIDKTKADIDLFYQRRLNKNFKMAASIGYTFLHNMKIYANTEKAPMKIYIFGGNKTSIPINPDGINFKIGIYWSTKD